MTRPPPNDTVTTEDMHARTLPSTPSRGSSHHLGSFVLSSDEEEDTTTGNADKRTPRKDEAKVTPSTPVNTSRSSPVKPTRLRNAGAGFSPIPGMSSEPLPPQRKSLYIS